MTTILNALTSSSGLAVSPDSSGVLQLQSNGTPTVTVDTSGNVGIGTSSPSSFNASARKLVVGSGTGNNGATIYAGAASQAGIYFANGTTGSQAYAGQFIYNHADNSFLTYVNGSTLATKIDSSGNLLFRTTSSGAGNTGWVFAATANTNFITTVCGSLIDGATHLSFQTAGVQKGYIAVSGGSTIYSTASDYRLKEDIKPMVGGLGKVMQLKPVTYRWIQEQVDSQGFIAHELQEVVPQCVMGEKDAVDADGNPVYQGIDTSFLVATLTAAIQEQQALITNLNTRLSDAAYLTELHQAVIEQQAATLTNLTERLTALEGAK